MRRANPALKNGFNKNYGVIEGRVMTLGGTVNKTFMLLSLAMVTAVFTWITFYKGNMSLVSSLMTIGCFGSLIVGVITVFKPNIAMITAPMYALLEGLALGGISAYFELSYEGIVIQAIMITMAVLLSLLILYKSRIIKPTENFKLGVCAATMGIGLVYLISMIMRFFGSEIYFIHESGLIGILFSVFVVIIASLNLVLDFDFIENGVDRGYPDYMEWYGAYGLMVTLVWLYLEILRLLAKLNDRD
ncbi:Bax inhibitor-1/YccA family protein [Inediibacterium massiliense]|uniref:Bax inhibitor-1/YccA family protein n=1 Tax=Inediibacterium massiliense TaxID=1658111 RepID=UPI0006B5DDE7|nr:Bax inhibitor-1/YccA family protein [Inediibacterium massiliense]